MTSIHRIEILQQKAKKSKVYTLLR